MLRDSVAAVVRTRPRAIPLAMITMRKSAHGFPFVSHIWDAYGAPLGGPSGPGAPLLTQVVRTQRKTLFKELAFKHLTSTFVSLTEEFQ